MVQHQPCHVAVLQVFQLFFEHGRLQQAVAIQQGKAAQGLACQDRFHDRQDGRDAAAARNAHVVPLRSRIGRNEETALRRHDLQGVAMLEVAVDPVGKHPAIHFAHAYAQLAVVNACADGVAAAQVLAIDRGAQREVLALREAEDRLQLWRYVKRNNHGLRRIGLDAGYAQRVEHGARHGFSRAWCG